MSTECPCVCNSLVIGPRQFIGIKLCKVCVNVFYTESLIMVFHIMINCMEKTWQCEHLVGFYGTTVALVYLWFIANGASIASFRLLGYRKAWVCCVYKTGWVNSGWLLLMRYQVGKASINAPLMWALCAWYDWAVCNSLWLVYFCRYR